MRLLLLSVLAAVACKSNAGETESSSTAPVKDEPNRLDPSPTEVPVAVELDTPMKRDLDRICNSEEQSGALFEEPNARAQHVAVWLATNLESQEARTLSAELVTLAPEDRIAHLQTVLKEHDMGDCEILATW